MSAVLRTLDFLFYMHAYTYIYVYLKVKEFKSLLDHWVDLGGCLNLVVYKSMGAQKTLYQQVHRRLRYVCMYICMLVCCAVLYAVFCH